MGFLLSLRQCLHIYPKLGLLLGGMVVSYTVTKYAYSVLLSDVFCVSPFFFPVFLTITGLFITMLSLLELATVLNLALSVNFI